MTPRTRSIAIVVMTLMVGMILGGVIVGALSMHRVREMRDIGRPGGFVAHMEELIAPADSAQRRAIRPLLERTDQRNRAIVDGARHQMEMAFDTMITELAPHLTPAQMERLRDELQHRRDGHGPPPPGLGPPPPDHGPPPERE